MKIFFSQHIIFFLLAVISNPYILIKIFKIKIISDSYLLTILSALISIFFVFIFLGNYSKLRKLIKVVFIPYFIFFILFGCFSLFEIYSSNILSKNKIFSVHMSNNFVSLFEPDEYSGYKLSKNFSNTVLKISNKDTIYKAYYETDSFHRRKIEGNHYSDSNHLIFFGCSYTFGDGVSNSEIFPQLLKNFFKEKFSVYNYGVPGYGTQQMLTKLQFGEFEKEIVQKKGIAIYVYVPGIIPRNIGAFSTFGWSNTYPLYTVENHKLKYFKSSFEASPLRSKFYKIMNHFNTFKYLKNIKNFDHPKVSNDHINLTSKIILESKKKYQKKFENSEFYVLIFPHSHGFDTNTEKLKNQLVSDGLDVLDFSRFADTISNKFIPIDDTLLHLFIKNQL